MSSERRHRCERSFRDQRRPWRVKKHGEKPVFAMIITFAEDRPEDQQGRWKPPPASGRSFVMFKHSLFRREFIRSHRRGWLTGGGFPRGVRDTRFKRGGKETTSRLRRVSISWPETAPPHIHTGEHGGRSDGASSSWRLDEITPPPY